MCAAPVRVQVDFIAVALGVCRNVSLDPSAAILWVMAVATVVGAAVWAGSDFMQEVKCTGRDADDEVITQNGVTSGHANVENASACEGRGVS